MGGKVAVLNPRVADPVGELVPMATRLDGLEGKTIYIVSVNFPYTWPFFEVLKSELERLYPTTRWMLKLKKGSYFDDDEELWEEIGQRANGVILGVGQLDTCAPMVIIFCSKLERMGVPTAPIVTAAFVELTRDFARKRGVPTLPFTFIPHPYANRPVSLYQQYVAGRDPITGKPIIDEIVEALTKQPAPPHDCKVVVKSEPRVLGPATEEELTKEFHSKGWTDGLPIILPTEERVARMLTGTSHKPDEVVGEMRPSPPYYPRRYTVENVAINAVMAGALPEHFPVILAIAQTGVSSLFSSATSQARMAVVNGPIRHEIGMNGGLAALGPFNQANAVIGRAWTLISKNLGGVTPRLTYLGDIGSNFNYNNLCFAENEEALPPGWMPLHVQKGFKPQESVVSILWGWSLLNYGAYKPYPHVEAMKRQLRAFENSGAGTHHTPGARPVSQAALLLSPITAQDLYQEGFVTKEDLSKWLKENTMTTLWNYWARNPEARQLAEAGTEPFASLLKLPLDNEAPEPLFVQPEVPIEVLVVGGGTDAFWIAADFRCEASASIDYWR